MKKTLTYVLIIMIFAVGILVLTGCSSNEKNGGLKYYQKIKMYQK